MAVTFPLVGFDEAVIIVQEVELELMAGDVGCTDGLELDGQLGLFDFQQGERFLVMILLRLTLWGVVGKDSGSSPLVRRLSPLQIIPRLAPLPGWPGRDRNLTHFMPVCAQSARHLLAKTGGVKREKVAKIGRAGNKEAL